MPLIFIHGVNVRYDPANDPYVNARDEMFRQFVLPRLSPAAPTTSILNPYWGHLAAKFPFNYGGLPMGEYERFGDAEEEVADLVTIPGVTQAAPDAVLLAVARGASLARAVDIVWTLAAQDIDRRDAREWSASAAAVAEYAEVYPHPDWLATVRNDGDFLKVLLERATLNGKRTPAMVESESDVEILGLINRTPRTVTRAAAQLRTAVSGVVSRLNAGERRIIDAALLRIRTPLHKMLITFLGDILAYFNQQGSARKDIANAILTDFDRAASQRTAGDPLVVVAHSMGGIIMYDLLTSVRSSTEVDAFVTIGSQVAVFEEQRLFAASVASMASSAAKVQKPRNIERWINAFDTRDVLGFPAGGVFDGVEDYFFATGHVWAHGGYFVEPTFHQRLGARL